MKRSLLREEKTINRLYKNTKGILQKSGDEDILKLIMKHFVFSIFLLLSFPVFAFAGTIDATNKYARFLDTDALINFGTTNGNVAVSDTTITGYAWGTDVGWINLAPASGGVVNNGSGVLSGYAWSENTGWINFKPTNGGVTIDSSGNFNGYAWSELKGWIVFNCATDSTCGTLSHKVQTNWAIAVVAPVASGGGGIISQPAAPVPTPEPTPDPIPEPTPTPEPIPTIEPTSFPIAETPPAPPQVSEGSQGGTTGGVSSGGTAPSAVEIFSNQVTDVVINVLTNAKELFSNINDVVGQGIVQARKAINQARQQAKTTLQTPIGDTTNKTITTVGVVAGSATSLFSVLFTQVFSLKDLLFLPAQLWGLILSVLGIKRRHRPWGAVYDSVTKQPLDPAYVELQTLDGKEVATAFTDLDGRYGFLVPPGTYRIVANKTNYKFPSERLAGKTGDEFYGNLYFGDTIVLNEGDVFLAQDIPMDPEGFDWNEYAKRAQHLMGFYSRNTILIERLSHIFFIVGFLVTLFVLFVDPQPYTIAIFVLYIFVWGLRKVGPGDRPHGVVIDKATGLPLAFGVVQVSHPDSNVTVRKSITDALGRYYCLVTKGVYNVEVMRKEQDGTYSSVNFSKAVQAPRGIIREKFEV